MASSIDCPPRPCHRAGRQAGAPARVRGRVASAAVVLAVLAALSGCGAGAGTAQRDVPVSGAPDTAGVAPGATGTAQGRAGTGARTLAPARIPGLGPRTRAWIPANARQVVVVTGRGKDANRSRVVLYEHTGSGWEGGPAWPAHNALKGWTDDHWAGDLRSPIGVFTLTDAGGLLPDPGTRLPYDRSQGFAVGGTGFEGEPLEGSFDYVVAIDYNRVPGTSPLDRTRPLGADRGGGIWLHVDHEGPTQGCVSLSERHMEELLRALDPDRHPVIVMGDAGSLRE
ncbi:L,D-transpeptidase family protein [Streptomyces sp. XY152]|uniref:L,D-transpeptidase family protein n=1 Tax=Streptomyces sp. XY152 TaxID=1415560 RepID=UPI0006ADF740|nr:L,D-transpeptidase family protein [Streptomyces sp. XY152]KOV35545.1 lipoprotein [Streptomyces sp. XY152]